MSVILEFLYDYSKNIALFLIFITLVGIISPSLKYKNYISLILGLILIFVIITPIADFIGDSGTIESLILKMGLDVDRNIIGNERSYYQDEQRELIYQLYEEKIKKQVVMVVESDSNFTIEDVELDISDDDNSFGEIKNIYLTLSEKEVEAEQKKKLIRIDPIKINNRTTVENDDRLQNLIILLKDFYNLSESNIHIKNTKE